SGFQKPSKKNQEAFDRAVSEITEASARLLAAIETPATQAIQRQADSINI
ncbi:MAG: DUF2277 family protein, partial [Bryobacteraceae bacterium]